MSKAMTAAMIARAKARRAARRGRSFDHLAEARDRLGCNIPEFLRGCAAINAIEAADAFDFIGGSIYA